jgi:hypothetical protein
VTIYRKIVFFVCFLSTSLLNGYSIQRFKKDAFHCLETIYQESGDGIVEFEQDDLVNHHLEALLRKAKSKFSINQRRKYIAEGVKEIVSSIHVLSDLERKNIDDFIQKLKIVMSNSPESLALEENLKRTSNELDTLASPAYLNDDERACALAKCKLIKYR